VLLCERGLHSGRRLLGSPNAHIRREHLHHNKGCRQTHKVTRHKPAHPLGITQSVNSTPQRNHCQLHASVVDTRELPTVPAFVTMQLACHHHVKSSSWNTHSNVVTSHYTKSANYWETYLTRRVKQTSRQPKPTSQTATGSSNQQGLQPCNIHTWPWGHSTNAHSVVLKQHPLVVMASLTSATAPSRRHHRRLQ